MRTLNKQIAVTKLDPTVLQMPIFGGAIRLSHRDGLIANNTSWQALEIYLDLLNDARLQAVLSKQFNEIISKPLLIEPGNKPGTKPSSDDKSAASFAQDVLDELQTENQLGDAFAFLSGDQSFDSLVKSLLIAVVTHLSSAELIWRRDARGRAVVDRAIAIDPRRWAFFDNDGRIQAKLITRTSSYTGVDVPANKFVFHRHWAIYGSDQLGAGYGPALYWLIQWKREAMTFWLSVLDRHADPALIGTMPRNATAQDIQAFVEALNGFSRETNVAIKEGFSISALNSDPGRASDLLKALIDYIDSEINILLTGEEAIGSSTMANANVRNNIRLMSAKAWSDALHGTLRSSLLTWLTRLNWPKAAVPKISRRWQTVDEVLNVASTYKQLGLAVEHDFLEQATGVPIAKQEAKQTTIPKAPPGLL